MMAEKKSRWRADVATELRPRFENHPLRLPGAPLAAHRFPKLPESAVTGQSSKFVL